MKKVVIIGGGAAGLTTSIYAANLENEVLVLERNPSCLKKVSITGNGRCNYWNQDQSLAHYHSSADQLLSSFISSDKQEEILSFFHSIGIIPKIKNGYYYPFSNQATSVAQALFLAARDRQVKFQQDVFVDEIIWEKDHFVINPEKEKIYADIVVIATGSKAYPKTGSDGSGYHLATSFGHTLVPVLPALVQLKVRGNYLKEWKGIRCDVRLVTRCEGREIQQEEGEVQLTEYGLSGICTLNISSEISKLLEKGKQVEVDIHFLPWIESIEKMEEWLQSRAQLFPKRTLEELLETVLPYKLVHVLFSYYHIDFHKRWQQLTLEEKNTVSRFLFCHPVEITGTHSFDQAQVCSGGVPLTELDPRSMESKKKENLYFVGEIVDVNGDCGGYNLGFAFLSGMMAGKKIGGEK